MKSKEDTQNRYREEWKGWEDEKYDDINTFLGQLDSPSSPRQYPANIPQLYPHCVNVDSYSPSPSILIDFNNGRLGNQISGVASVLCLATTLGITPMMTHKTFKVLDTYFENIDRRVKILESKFCAPWKDLKFDKLDKIQGSEGQVLVMTAYPNTFELYPTCLPQVRDIFNIRKKYLDAATDLVSNVVAKSGKKDAKVVTIHCRRTDYKIHVKVMGTTIVSGQYFMDAMDFVRSQAGGDNVVFIVVSDDMDWSRVHIVGDDVHYSDSGATMDGVGTDLALMLATDMTILSHGTFGLWGALLAEKSGDIIVPPGHELETLKQDPAFQRNIHVISDADSRH